MRTLADVVAEIRASGLSIYDVLTDRQELYLSTPALQTLLQKGLVGLNLNYPIRTRSKVLKSKICEVLGYPVPPVFARTQPRYLGQNLDVFAQKSNNLQIWNEEVDPSRRYAIVRVAADDRVDAVRVVEGQLISSYDRTGTLTQKFQARSHEPVEHSVLVTAADTDTVERLLLIAPQREDPMAPNAVHMGWPKRGRFLPVVELFARLEPLVGTVLHNPGADQERNRGAELHRLVCRQLGEHDAADNGQFPDVPSQLCEVKLQTSPTIDLGLVSPDGLGAIASVPAFRHCDVRYAIFYGTMQQLGVRLDHLVVSTGQEFFTFFRRFEGMVVNKKLQIPLPFDFFA